MLPTRPATSTCAPVRTSAASSAVPLVQFGRRIGAVEAHGIGIDAQRTQRVALGPSLADQGIDGGLVLDLLHPTSSRPCGRHCATRMRAGCQLGEKPSSHRYFPPVSSAQNRRPASRQIITYTLLLSGHSEIPRRWIPGSRETGANMWRNRVSIVCAAFVLLASVVPIVLTGAVEPAGAAPPTSALPAPVAGVITLTGDCDTTAPLTIPNGVTLNGAGHTITAHDMTPGTPSFDGAVLTNAAVDVDEHRELDDHGQRSHPAPGCAGNVERHVFNGAGGSVTNVTVTGISENSALSSWTGDRGQRNCWSDPHDHRHHRQRLPEERDPGDGDDHERLG